MHRFDRSRQALAVGLSALAGAVDAIGFMSAGGYFFSFMSGNTTRLAVDLSLDLRTADTPAMLIGGFVCGVAAGAVIALRAGPWRKPAVVGFVAALLLIAAACQSTGHPLPALALMVLAMGAINNTFQRDGEVTIGLTYMTGALVRLGQGLGAVIAGEPRPGWGRWGVLWLGLTSGALAGALAWRHFGNGALWLAAGAALIATLAAWRIAAREQIQTSS